MENQRIQVILHKNGKEFPVLVNLFDPVSILSTQFQSKNPLILMFKNMTLLSAFTFAFYGITDGSHIFLIEHKTDKPNPRPKDVNREIAKNIIGREEFKKIFRRMRSSGDEEESFETSYKTYVDANFAREAAKIKDRFFQRVEGTIKCHRKLIKHYVQSSHNRIHPPMKKEKEKEEDKEEKD